MSADFFQKDFFLEILSGNYTIRVSNSLNLRSVDITSRQREISVDPEASSTMRVLMGARCTDVRFYTLRKKNRYQNNERPRTLALLNLPSICWFSFFLKNKS